MKQGWERKRLGEIAKVAYGYTEKASYKEIGPKFLRITDIQENDVNWETVPYCKINIDDLEKYKLSNGDIVFARTGATTGKSYLVKDPPNSVFASYLIKVHIEQSNILSNFLQQFFQTKTYWDCINEGISGSAQGGFNATKLSELLIPIPPLPEQHRILSIIDQAFAAIDKAKANAERNLKNAKDLFESYLQRVFSTKNEKWEVKCLDELGVITSSKRIYKSEYVKDGVPFYRTKEIKELSNGKDISLELYISRERYSEIKKSFGVPQINDLLMSAVGTIGEILVIENDDEFYFKDGNILWLRDFKNLDTNYLKFALTAFVEKIKSLAIGAAYIALTIEKLNKYRISFPKSRIEQKSIVEKLDALSAKTKRLEAIYQQKLINLEELKKSILHKAFSGEL